MIGEWSEQDEPLEVDNSREFFDIVAPMSPDGPVNDRIVRVALRLCDSINFLRMCETMQQNLFKDIPSASSSSSLFALFPELSGPEAVAETEPQPQITERDEWQEPDEFDVTNAQLAVSAMVEHLGGVYSLSERQMRHAFTIARQREARTRLAADDKRVLESITLRKAPPTPYQDRLDK